MTQAPVDNPARPVDVDLVNGEVGIPVDDVCAGAVELARSAAVEVAGAEVVGDHVAVVADAERVVTHFFAANERGYVGWRWAVTVVRAPRSKQVTVDEVVLLPGPGALLPPPWVPWSSRLQAGDVGVGDVVPTAADDERLVPGYAGAGPHDDLGGRDASLDRADEFGDLDAVAEIDTIDALVHDLWLGRPRVLSELGREEAAQRWYDGDHGPTAPIARAAELACTSCGFLVLLRGALGRAFGVCANEFAPDDGRVVSLDHGCGAHSEALVVYNEPVAEVLLGAAELGELVEDAQDQSEDAEEQSDESAEQLFDESAETAETAETAVLTDDSPDAQ